MKKIFLIAALGVAGLASANGVLTTEKTVRGESSSEEPIQVYYRCFLEDGKEVPCPEVLYYTEEEEDSK